ncbi:aspartate dehydrogenase domain-containing protein [Gordonia sp. CPCC 205515]|uniref:aspartate dehydrogenase domain-containing protein n=1 Tax=Gordonia sp. CPCC 205515 TaxID=3140791 RepID=UPI003AF340D1
MTHTRGDTLRVAVLGRGSIGAVVAQRLASGAVDGAELSCVVGRTATGDALPLDEALACSDVVVECAGQPALHQHALAIVESGCDLVVTSVGALCADGLGKRLRDAGPGRTICTHGAIGGLDLLASAADADGVDSVTVRSTKKPAGLVRPWMSAPEVHRIEGASVPIEVFRGSAEDAAQLFPESLNVAAAVDFAVRGGGATTVELVADPHATLTRHEIHADGPMGRYTFVVENRPSPENPKSSAVVPYSVLRTVAGLTRALPLIA